MKTHHIGLLALLNLSLYSCNSPGEFGGKSVSINQGSVKVDNSAKDKVADHHADHNEEVTSGDNSSDPSGGSTSGGHEGGDLGVIGGHFDLDTAHMTYPLNQGTSDAHIHEYDDLHGNEVDYFNMADPVLGEIQDIITDVNQPFFILVSNAELSTSPVLQINGVDHNVVTYQNTIRTILAANGTPQKYILGNNPPAGVQKLSSLKLIVPVNALSKKDGLIATSKGCAIQNNPGQKGEYRSGSLTIQAISSEGFHIDPVMKVASTATDTLLWESFIFWHKDNNCY